MVKNIFERILLQSIRLSAFLKLSPKWKSQQNVSFILQFCLKIAKRIYNLGKKWNDLNTIEFKLNHKEIQLIAVIALLNQWTFGKISHRKQERKALNELKRCLQININKEQKNSMIYNYLNFIPKNNLLKPFDQIMFRD